MLYNSSQKQNFFMPYIKIFQGLFLNVGNCCSWQNSIEPLKPSKGLYRIAQDFLRRIQRKNADSKIKQC